MIFRESRNATFRRWIACLVRRAIGLGLDENEATGLGQTVLMALERALILDRARQFSDPRRALPQRFSHDGGFSRQTTPDNA